ncbi:MAG: ThiF family adenylyltransferase [Candidatus Cloacimonetes bacterium]|nr:ThiF family adenylyltransferase [Candidatus Cloacimonadota bacterium]
MLSDSTLLHENIKVAVRSSQDIEVASFIELNRNNDDENWELCVDLALEESNEFIPAVTRWWYILSSNYPFGDIKCYPDSVLGIKSTHNHQDSNIQLPDKKWAEGKLCLTEPFGLDRVSQHNDPVGNSETRLKWYILRTIAWIQAAVNDDLVGCQEPFELPYIKHDSDLSDFRLAYIEGQDSLINWKNHYQCSGKATISSLRSITTRGIISQFKDWKNKEVISKWSKATVDYRTETDLLCLWWLWERPIVLPPWQSPRNWGEIRAIGKQQGIDVDKTLQMISNRVRDKGACILLLGYPIPKIKGESNCEIHFDAIRLPNITSTKKPERGFRNNDLGFWMRERRETFSNQREIAYMHIENWHPDRLLARGRITEKLREMPTIVIGVGALGSVIAEILVREGLLSILLIDNDVLSAGNVVRHTLTLNDIGKNKTEVLKAKLEAINPLVVVETLAAKLPENLTDLYDVINDYRLVVDCTGSDEVLMLLSKPKSSIPKYFASYSLGYRADRLYAYIESGFAFSGDSFEDSYRIWKEIEALEWQSDGETIEGAGCWSPLFPARYDDIVIAGSICVKLLEKLVTYNCQLSQFMVFERLIESDICTGYKEVTAKQ